MSIEKGMEKVLFPEDGILQRAGDVMKAIIVDVELDPIECDFDGYGNVEINTELKNVVFDEAHLKKLIKLLKESQK